MDQNANMTMKGVTRSDKPSVNCHTTLQLPSALWRLFVSLIVFKPYWYGSVSLLSSTLTNPDKSTVCYLSSTKLQRHKVNSYQLAHEHSGAFNR